MSAQTPSQAGTRIEAPAMNTTVRLVTTLDKYTERTAPGCNRSPMMSDDLSLTLGPLWERISIEAIGIEVAIYSSSSPVAHVHPDDYPDSVHSSLGHVVTRPDNALSRDCL